MTKRFGFTLAEVLITLGIIGVVAAMTIPTLMNQTGQAEFKTGFKKIVSTLNQAITMNVALDSADFSVLASGTSTNPNSIYNMFSTRMNIISATTGDVSGSMGGATAAFNGSGSNYTFFFNDGMVISFATTAASCTTANQAGCRMAVDVNGTKKPNILSVATSAASTARIGDQYVLDFFNQQVLPHDEKARYVLYN
jgi:prepilin-type N-terminal cleavage/methylation domain-containing protein